MAPAGETDANDYSGGTGRAPCEEGAAGASVGATAATAAGGRVSNPSSRASDRSKTADDMGRRPELPAAVGPVINMERGETRYSFLAGIAAHDGGGILSSGFQRQPRVVPTVLKGEKGRFQKIKHEFLLKENMLDISGHFASQGTRLIPVVDPLKHKAVLLREGFSSEEIKGAHQVWDFIDGWLQSEANISILKRCKSPREAFDHLEKLYDPESEVATQKLYDKFYDSTIPPNSNLIGVLHALEDTKNQMADKGVGIADTFLHAQVVSALPNEYGHIRVTLQAIKNRDRAEIVRMVGTRYSTLPQNNGS